LSDPIRIRPAARSDVPLLHTLITALAAYERAPEQVTGTEAMLERALFDGESTAEAVVAERAGAPVGFALFYPTFSTWLCQAGLYLEDLFVPPEHRGTGVGRELLAHVAALAVERGASRLEWVALDWNEPAIGFYESLGAARMEDWELFRLAGLDLVRLARASRRAP
jgi:GNAT superfamily N-acetyltransferase